MEYLSNFTDHCVVWISEFEIPSTSLIKITLRIKLILKLQTNFSNYYLNCLLSEKSILQKQSIVEDDYLLTDDALPYQKVMEVIHF